MELLAGANALETISGHRHQSYWQLLGHETAAPLWVSDTDDDPGYLAEESDGTDLPPPRKARTSWRITPARA